MIRRRSTSLRVVRGVAEALPSRRTARTPWCARDPLQRFGSGGGGGGDASNPESLALLFIEHVLSAG